MIFRKKHVSNLCIYMYSMVLLHIVHLFIIVSICCCYCYLFSHSVYERVTHVANIWIPKISILDIQNAAERTFYSGYPK